MKKICSFNGCVNEVRRAGLCGSHYNQKIKGKELKPLQLQYHGLTEEDRFLKRVIVKGKDECWEWTGSRNQDNWHGQWRNKDGEIELTHRASFRLFKCDIPGGLFVLHKCDNPICVNPNHLFLGTQSDNIKDMWAKGRANPKPSLGSKHGISKLSENEVLQIRGSTESGKSLSEKYGVTQTTISDIRHRRIWKHI